jgi:thioredoxin reductase/Pyruvate/2-oxoacid:ferredoxin oxidoreductase delta subunit
MAPKDHQYATGVERYPELDKHLQSNVKGLHIIGAANGSPLLKTSINEGVQVIRSLARIMPPARDNRGPEDLVIVGAGPAGLTAALEAKKRGYRFKLLEQGRPLNTILNFPAGKHIYAEPATLRSLGDLDFDDSTKEKLLESWSAKCAEVDIVQPANVTEINKRANQFEVITAEGDRFAARRVILAIGRMGNPRKLGVPGEDLPCVYPALLNPGKYQDKQIVVIGGGNSAAECAISLAPKNQVALIHRGDGFPRLSSTNRSLLKKAQQEHGLQIHLLTKVHQFRRGQIEISTKEGKRQTLKRDVAFVLIGADPPTSFLKRLGVNFSGEWTLRILPKLAWVFAMVYSVYAVKFGLWPFKATYQLLTDLDVRPDLLYGILYTVLVTSFGTRALRKYQHDQYQRKRYATLIACQWLVYFLLPWSLYYAHYTEWWRTWAISLPFPLGYYGLWEPGRTLFTGTSLPWALGAAIAFLVVMPLFSRHHGKRFCAWVCPCGGMADTLGDGFRHKSPRGKGIRRLETSETVILVLTVLVSLYLISGYRNLLDPGQVKNIYKSIVDIGLASIFAITLYPFGGNRIWCRFFCPLSKWMELWGRWAGGKLAIVPNDECISCGECTHFCQMGIDVRAFAQREEPLSNRTTSCIFCGICVTVCPVDVLHLEHKAAGH